MKISLFLTILLLTNTLPLVALAKPASIGSFCESIYTKFFGSAYGGRYVKTINGEDYFELKNDFFTRVYRVVPVDRTKSPYIKRIYSKISRAENDLKAFLYFKNLFADYNISINVLTPQKAMSKRELRLEYKRGITLRSFLTDKSNIAEEKKLMLGTRFKAAIDAFHDDIHDSKYLKFFTSTNSPEIVGKSINATLLDSKSSTGVLRLRLNLDNIIVDPETLEMTLIDPS